ncbi:hypothetical protein RM543_03200 [Roseicyclus sp. F158]|uniref:HEAT repeat domain-containing protein n=1 Tax=Tropicimonas omnivorans TaxID=3075590 RepID=A0ABU3DD80_9RHOB|nr:hypothetical protein [Roseicyclus sp. F158]MDT0681679.1 hypothetical protein [Roseicyclus sp. F158]
MIARLTIVAAFIAGSAAAEPVRVLSGEHADFTRIVLIFDAPTSWSVSETETGYDVRFDRDDFALDLGRVFDRIPRDRITGVSQEGAALAIDTGPECPCSLTVFEAGGNAVAIDVKDAPDDSEDAAPALPTTFPASVGGAAVEESDPAPVLPAAKDLSDAAENADLLTMEADLLEQIGRAASSGFVKVATPLPDPEPRPDPGVGEVPAPVESEVAGRSRQVSSPTRDKTCPDIAFLDVVSDDDGDPLLAVAQARGDLIDGRGDLDRTAALALAEAYLNIGFGAEADQALDIAERPQSDVRRAVARIVDGRLDETLAFVDSHDCGGMTTLLAVVADTASQLLTQDIADIEAAFASLTAPLQRNFGPRLAAHLEDTGHPEAARRLRLKSRLRFDEGLVAPIGLVEPDAGAETTRSLRDIVREGGPDAPEALLGILERVLEDSGIPAQEDLALSETFIKERHEEDVTPDLLAALALARARGGEASRAIAALADLSATSPEAEVDDLVEKVAGAIAQLPSDGLFLSGIYEMKLAGYLPDLAEGPAIAIAERTLTLGLPALAKNAMTGLRGVNSPEINALRARVADDRGDRRLAEALSSGEVEQPVAEETPDPPLVPPRPESVSLESSNAALEAGRSTRSRIEALLSGEGADD